MSLEILINDDLKSGKIKNVAIDILTFSIYNLISCVENNFTIEEVKQELILKYKENAIIKFYNAIIEDFFYDFIPLLKKYIPNIEVREYISTHTNMAFLNNQLIEMSIDYFFKQCFNDFDKVMTFQLLNRLIDFLEN